jgi:hypothetical protein
MAGEEVGDGAVPGEEGLPSSWLPSPEITENDKQYRLLSHLTLNMIQFEFQLKYQEYQ